MEWELELELWFMGTAQPGSACTMWTSFLYIVIFGVLDIRHWGSGLEYYGLLYCHLRMQFSRRIHQLDGIHRLMIIADENALKMHLDNDEIE
jgi:hypothetical protein